VCNKLGLPCPLGLALWAAVPPDDFETHLSPYPSGGDFALLVDGLEAEREQGITIDVAYRFFATDQRAKSAHSSDVQAQDRASRLVIEWVAGPARWSRSGD